MANSANPEPVITASAVTNFSEIAIRAPRPGFFVGDCVHEDINPIVRHYELNQNIPPPPRLFPLGSLTRLPIEILYDILSRLDILSVLDFRSVNQRSAAVVTSSREFNIVASFPKALSAVVNMRCRFYSLGRLAACLSDTRCSRCEEGHFGELLYLITAERVCWSCWRRFRDLIPMTRKNGPELPVETLERIPQITALLGLYGGDPLPCSIIKSRGPFFDRRAFVAELEKLHASQGQVYSDLDPEPDRAKLRAPKSAEDAAYRGHRFQRIMNIRFTVFLRAPYFDQDLQTFVGGYFCRACIGRDVFSYKVRYKLEWRFPEAIWHEPWRRYTREGFWEHVEKYGQILRNDIDGTFVHDGPRRETQTPDDVQWEMYQYEDELLADGMDWRDDQPALNMHNGKLVPHNCQ